jgi:hypothetical protein
MAVSTLVVVGGVLLLFALAMMGLLLTMAAVFTRIR